MNVRLIATPRMARRDVLILAAVAAAALSVGAYPGDARVIGHPGAHGKLSLSLVPRAVRLTPGSSVRLTVVIRRHHLNGRVRLAVVSKLPRGLTVHFAPARARGRRSVLTLRATLRLRPGRYALIVRGVDRHARRRIKLVVTVLRPATTLPPAGTPNASAGGGSSTADAGPAFTISGNPGQVLVPGVSQPIDLQIDNPNSSSLTLSTLTVELGGVDAPQATPTLPCATGDFSVQQYSGLLPLVIAPNSTVNLQQLGVPQSDWPQVSMLDRATNQDGCQGASLSLSYGAAASLG